MPFSGDPDVNEILLQKDDISLTWKGDVQISYSPSTCQLGYNESRNEYRVYDDKLANWFVLKCSEAPSEPGQIISSDVSWTLDGEYQEGAEEICIRNLVGAIDILLLFFQRQGQGLRK